MDERWLAVRRWYHRHERQLVRIWLGLVLLFLLGAVLPVSRSGALRATQRAANYWDERWSRRLLEGEALVDAGAWTRAVEHLSALDREFPARHVKHARDRERERLLRALGRSLTELDRKALALDTYRRLAAFDELNYANHHALGVALIRFNEPIEAELALARALELNPVHLPSLGALAQLRFDAGDYGAVVSLFESYVQAYRLHSVRLLLGDTAITIPVPVDGGWHDAAALLVLAPGWRGDLGMDTGGLSAELSSVVLTAPQLAGQPGQTRLSLEPGEGTAWAVEGAYASDGTAPADTFRLTVPRAEAGVERIELRLRLRKPVDPELWRVVELSYRNRLDWDGLAAARAAVHVHPSALSAERVFFADE